MQASSARTARWLRLLVALVLLLNTAGLHELLHERLGPEAAQAASGHIEAHAGDCQHRQELPALHEHACLVCKLGPANATPLPAVAAVPAPAPAVRFAFMRRADRAPTSCLPGELGARGPPVTSA